MIEMCKYHTVTFSLKVRDSCSAHTDERPVVLVHRGAPVPLVLTVFPAHTSDRVRFATLLIIHMGHSLCNSRSLTRTHSCLQIKSTSFSSWHGFVHNGPGWRVLWRHWRRKLLTTNCDCEADWNSFGGSIFSPMFHSKCNIFSCWLKHKFFKFKQVS